KCFIQINSESVNTNYSTIDVLDAFEGKTYATYIGHIVCDNTFTGNTKICQSDSGNIWFDGNNVRNPSDYRVGFGGIINGGIGDTNTQKQFLEHIHPFMND
ncbi:MAG: hypothetical protein NTV03_00400, partial [Candidatus Nomurabacteria bacterium]|nr:hypothetical protein [Candidatus Nomurabacteria bacterium]